jgi:hypothetical protein
MTGVVVNKDVGLSRQDRRRMRAMAHRLRQQNDLEKYPDLVAKLTGKLAYLSMLNSEQAARLHTFRNT